MTQLINNKTGKRISFLWVEHLDPSDGIGFARGAESKIPGVESFANLAKDAKGRSYDDGYDIPVGDENRAGIEILEAKNIGTVDAFNLSCGNINGWITFNSDRGHGVEGAVDNIDYLKSPSVHCSNGDASPNIYILSGHGALGRIYGDVDRTGLAGVGDIYPDRLTPNNSIKLLILPCCSNLSYGVASRYIKMFKESSLFAILGYVDTYGGGNHSAQVFSDFAIRLRKGTPVIQAWREANQKGIDQKGMYPWGAMFYQNDQNFTIFDCIKRQPALGTVVHISHRNATPKEINIPDIQIMINALTGTEDELFGDQEKLKETLNKSATTDCGGNRFANITNNSTPLLFIRRIDKKKFLTGDVLVIKFCAIRPNYIHQLSIRELFPNGIRETPALYTLKYLPTIDGNIVELHIRCECSELIIPIKPSPKIESYLRTSSGIPATSNALGRLVLYAAECEMKDRNLVLKSDKSKFPYEKMKEDPKGSAPSWWRTSSHAIDQSAFSTAFWVAPDYNPNP